MARWRALLRITSHKCLSYLVSCVVSWCKESLKLHSLKCTSHQTLHSRITHTHTHKHKRIQTYELVHTCSNTSTHTHTRQPSHTLTHIHTHSRIHSYTHTHTHVSPCWFCTAVRLLWAASRYLTSLVVAHARRALNILSHTANAACWRSATACSAVWTSTSDLVVSITKKQTHKS